MTEFQINSNYYGSRILKYGTRIIRAHSSHLTAAFCCGSIRGDHNPDPDQGGRRGRRKRAAVAATLANLPSDLGRNRVLDAAASAEFWGLSLPHWRRLYHGESSAAGQGGRAQAWMARWRSLRCSRRTRWRTVGRGRGGMSARRSEAAWVPRRVFVVYLSGAVAKNDWRSKLVPRLREAPLADQGDLAAINPIYDMGFCSRPPSRELSATARGS